MAEYEEDEIELTEDEQAEKEEYDKAYYGDEDDADTEAEAEGSVEEEAEDEDEEPVDDENPVEDEKLVTLKWRGKEIKATQEEVIAMAQQNFDATHKYQEISDLRKSTKAQLDLIERAQGGDKHAIAEIIKKAKLSPVDLLDIEELEEDNEQGTADQAEPFISPRVAEMLDEVSRDRDLYEQLREIERDLPQPVIDRMAKDPETFYSIINEVRSGDAAIVMPEVHKEIAKLNGLDRSVVMGDIDAFASLYINVKNNLIQKAQPVEQQRATALQKNKVNANELSIKKSNGIQRRGAEVADAFNDDKAYQAILNRLAGSQ